MGENWVLTLPSFDIIYITNSKTQSGYYSTFIIGFKAFSISVAIDLSIPSPI